MSDAAPTLVCEICGYPDAIRLGDRVVCAECYEKAGSCCLEFGADDLWQSREDLQDTAKPNRLPSH